MSNIAVPTKNTGDQHTAAELNQQTGWINSPGKSLGAFSPAMVFDSQGNYSDYTPSASATVTFSASGIVAFQVRKVKIVLDGSQTLEAGTGTRLLNGSLGLLDAGTYDILFASFDSSEVLISVPGASITPPTPTPPTVTTMSVENAAPNSLVVVFNESVTASNVGYTFRVNTTPRTLTGISGSGTNTLTFTIGGLAIEDGQTLDLSYNSTTGDTTGTESELESFTQQSVTNNVTDSIITFSDTFTGTNLDTNKWNVTNPNSVDVAISQNDELIITTLGNSIISWDQNFLTAKKSGSDLEFDGSGEWAAMLDYKTIAGGVDKQGGVFIASASGSTLISLRARDTSPGEADLEFRFVDSDGTVIIAPGTQYLGSDPWPGSYRVLHVPNTLYYQFWNGSSWETIYSATTAGKIDTDLKYNIRFGDSSGDEAGGMTFDNSYITYSDFATQYPS